MMTFCSKKRLFNNESCFLGTSCYVPRWYSHCFTVEASGDPGDQRGRSIHHRSRHLRWHLERFRSGKNCRDFPKVHFLNVMLNGGRGIAVVVVVVVVVVVDQVPQVVRSLWCKLVILRSYSDPPQILLRSSMICICFVALFRIETGWNIYIASRSIWNQDTDPCWANVHSYPEKTKRTCATKIWFKHGSRMAAWFKQVWPVWWTVAWGRGRRRKNKMRKVQWHRLKEAARWVALYSARLMKVINCL